MTGIAVAALAIAAPGNSRLYGEEMAKETRSSQPFVGYCWSQVAPELQNLVSFEWLTLNKLEDPAGVKAATDKMPPGHRVIFLWDVHRDMIDHPDDRCRDENGKTGVHGGSIWLDHGVTLVRERLDDFFKQYKSLGGQLDVVVIDWEAGLSNWHLGNDLRRWKEIQDDPRFPEIAEKLGFSDLTTVAERWKQKDDSRLNYLRWNSLMQDRLASYLNEAIYAPIRKYYPNVTLSNYGYYHYSRELGVPDHNGHRYYLFGSGAHVGTHQSKELYTRLGNIAINPPEELKAYPHTPFNGFRHALNIMRCMAGSSDVPICPWFAYRRFSEGYTAAANHNLYQELIFHVGLSGAGAFLFWNPRPYAKGHDPTKFTSDEQDRLFSDCLKRLSGLVGQVDRRALSRKLVSWTSDYALSGMRAGNQTIWRFTPNLDGGAKRESTRVGTEATFQVGNRRISIPGGRVVVPEAELSDQGYWIVAPANVEEPRIE
ncbi:hypothetical protein ACFL1X_11145 [Candidatus Hydrogenedentota bacterium]